jgi:nicotinate-nucleotide pyrophosphorylase (carboxylating)
MMDPRPLLFSSVAERDVTAVLSASESGIIVHTGDAATSAADLGMTVDHCLAEGKPVEPGDEVLRVTGSPIQIALAEERLVGLVAKPSGIATAARRFVDHAGTDLQIVSGAWKKLPFSQKDMIRSAISAGGAAPRIADWPFAYLDKNFVAMLGGVRGALEAVAAHPELIDYKRIIQVVDVDGACVAAKDGAHIVFVDTGRIDDVSTISQALRASGLRERVQLAFGGGVQLTDIDRLRGLDVDIVDVGRAIVDAPLLDMTFRVVNVR